jgi:elongation factor Ts
MAEITAAMVRDLREKTGAGMMDCKKALVEANGDMEAAIDWLRKKGLSAAAKKSGRVAAEGLVAVASAPRTAAMVEINAETDFVARNEHFQAFCAAVAELALTVGEDIEALKAARYPGSVDLVEGGTSFRTVGEQLTHLIATIGENMSIRRAKRLHVSEGTVATYVHSAVKPGMGKIGVHVAAARPEALDVSFVEPSALEREKAVLTEQAKASGKPDAVIQKMVDGRIRKYYEEVVLLEQVWVHDGESRVKAVVEKAGVKLAGFARFQLGEGIEKQASDFAAEVAAAAGQG